MKKLIYLFYSLFLLVSCSEDKVMEQIQTKDKNSQNKPQVLSLSEKLNATTVDNYTIQKDLKYGSKKLHNYDLYLPNKQDESVESPAMIVIHGGGWSLLDKSYMDTQISHMTNQNKNMAIFNINHRLAGFAGVNYEDIIEDLDMVMNEIKSKRMKYGLTDDIIIYGYSSGGHLALEYSKLRNSNKNIKVVAAAAPPVDLTSKDLRNALIDDQNRRLKELLIGEPFSENPEAYAEASPINKVSPDSKPTLLIHGNNDQIIDKEQVQSLSEILSENDVNNKLVNIPNTGHGFENKQKEISKAIFNFLSQF